MNNQKAAITQHEFLSNGITLRAMAIRPTMLYHPSEQAVVVMATGDGRKGTQSSSWKPLTDTVLAAGASVFLFDFQGLGLSDGVQAYLTISAGVDNLRDAISALRSLDWAKTAFIGGLGSSFGACAMLILQGQESPFHALGLKSPASFLSEAYENEHGEEGMRMWASRGKSPITGYDYKAYLDSFKYNVYGLARNISCPTMIVHGAADTVVPVAQSRRLARVLRNCVALNILQSVNHDYKQPGALESLSQYQGAFFSEYLVGKRSEHEE